MWTADNRPDYPSDLTDAEWARRAADPAGLA